MGLLIASFRQLKLSVTKKLLSKDIIYVTIIVKSAFVVSNKISDAKKNLKVIKILDAKNLFEAKKF